LIFEPLMGVRSERALVRRFSIVWYERDWMAMHKSIFCGSWMPVNCWCKY